MGQDRKPNILILGLGNVLLQDEGLGVRALERLTADFPLPDHVQPLDGGTLGINLLPYLEGITHLLVLDALRTAEPPGTLVRLVYEDLAKAFSLKMSAHQTGLAELLALGGLQGSLPSRIVVCGMQPATIDWGVALSSQITAQIDPLVRMAVEELEAWGCSFPGTPGFRSVATCEGKNA